MQPGDSYTFDFLGPSLEENLFLNQITAFGWLYSWDYTANYTDNLQYGDMNTGHLGSFSEIAPVMLWFQFTDGWLYDYVYNIVGDEMDLYNYFYCYETTVGSDYILMQFAISAGGGCAEEYSGAGPLYFRLSKDSPPAGKPLPGVIAALAIGGAAFIGRKLKLRRTQ